MDPRARAWSIVALSLLCVLLAYVLLRTPPKVTPSPPHQQVHQAPGVPVPPTPSGEPELDQDMYRELPLFLGWPLPEVPSGPGGAGTGGAPGPGPALPAPPPTPQVLPTPEEQ